ncbi:MAG: MerR family DNA-binding transcriptional regulator [Pirellulales bacterium]
MSQAAELLGVAPNTIRAWGATGKLPEYRHPMNNYRLYRPDDVQSVLRQITGLTSTARSAASPPRRRSGVGARNAEHVGGAE